MTLFSFSLSTFCISGPALGSNLHHRQCCFRKTRTTKKTLTACSRFSRSHYILPRSFPSCHADGNLHRAPEEQQTCWNKPDLWFCHRLHTSAVQRQREVSYITVYTVQSLLRGTSRQTLACEATGTWRTPRWLMAARSVTFPPCRRGFVRSTEFKWISRGFLSRAFISTLCSFSKAVPVEREEKTKRSSVASPTDMVV